jgi:hypothetical protein
MLTCTVPGISAGFVFNMAYTVYKLHTNRTW